MKSRRRIITVIIIASLIIIIVVRLALNKRSFDEQLKMISEFNTTIPVITDTVNYKQISTEFSVNGTFQPLREISVTVEIQGKIHSISAKPGNYYKTGQVLASIENELFASQLNLANFNLEKAEKDMKRFEELSKGDAATIQQYESAKQVFVNAQMAYTTAKIQHENTFIRAPFDGLITKQDIEIGSYLLPGSPVFDMVEIDKVKCIAKLTSEEVEKVQKGQKVIVSVDAYPGMVYEGIVSAVIVKSDISKRYDVEVTVNNRADKLIKPGMFGTCLFSSGSGEQKQLLTIQRKAITGSIKNPVVFIVKGDSVISRNIIANPLNDKYIEVREGLIAGDVIVISGQINLVNGSKIKLNE